MGSFKNRESNYKNQFFTLKVLYFTLILILQLEMNVLQIFTLVIIFIGKNDSYFFMDVF